MLNSTAACQGNNRAMAKLGALTRLRRLGLAGTAIKDAGLALAGPLAALECLNLEWCPRITDAGAFSFQSFSFETFPFIAR